MDRALMKKALKFFGREEVFCAEHYTPSWPYFSVKERIQFKKQSNKSTYAFSIAEHYCIFEFFEWAWQYLHSYDPEQDEPRPLACLLLDKPEGVLSLTDDEMERRIIGSLAAFRIVNLMEDDALRTHYARNYLEQSSKVYDDERNHDSRKLLKNLYLPDDVEPLFFLGEFDRVEEAYPVAMNAIKRWRKKSYRPIGEVNTLAYEHKLNAFLHWVRAKQTTDPDQQREHARLAWRFFDKLISRKFYELQCEPFSYRLYSLWLRIEFDLDTEIVMEFLKYFKHLVRGYAPAWEKVKDIVPDPHRKSPIMEKREEEYYTHMRRAAEEVVESSYPDFLPGIMTQ